MYDFAGNPVISGTNDNILKSIPNFVRDTSTAYDIDIYWNCFSREGMPVAPGIYRIVIYAIPNYAIPNHPEYNGKKPFIITLGISR